MSGCVRYGPKRQDIWPSPAGPTPNPAGALLGELIRTSPRSLRAHHERVGAMASALAGLAGLDEEHALLIGVAGWLHDIGMVLVPREIHARRGVIGRDEREMIQEHCRWGHEILSMTEDPQLRMAARVALEHHERWDGSGYPARLRGEEISIEARIVAICSVYDTLRRPGHKDPIDHDDAIGQLLRCNPKTGLPGFDQALCGLFVANADMFRRIVENRGPAIVPSAALTADGAQGHVSRH